MLTLYAAPAAGSVAVEATLTLLGMPYSLIEAAPYKDPKARARVAAVNPMAQVPTLVWPSGEVMTESAAILVHLADQHPEAKLAPALGDPARGQFLRWMAYVAVAIYSLNWIRLDPRRIAVPADARDPVREALLERMAECWRMMDAQVMPGEYLLGHDLTVLDLYVAVVSRFAPYRRRFYDAAPKMTPVVRRVDADQRFQDIWAKRFPFDTGEG